MDSSYVIQRLQLNKNYHLIASVRETKDVAEKINNIENYLKEGADINFVDRNDEDSAPIHVAVHMSEPDIVQLLIKNGANLNLRNSNGETPLAIAQGLNTDTKQEIVNLLQTATESENRNPQNSAPEEISQNLSKNSVQTQKNTSKSEKEKEYKYTKRTGTSGVCGQLYETKLLTLVLMRALNSHPDVGGVEIEHFYLGTNISGIGDLDDVCLRYRLKGHPNDIVLFLQAKHRENPEKGKVTDEDLRSASGDFSLRKYFDSYLKIKDKFQTKNIKETNKKIKNQSKTGKDVLFEGEFSSVECNLILYTPAKDSLAEEKTKIRHNDVSKIVQRVTNTIQEQTTEKKKMDKSVSKNVHYLINTGTETQQQHNNKTENEEIFQYNYDEEDIDYLTKMTVIKRIKELGTEFLKLIMNEADKSQVILAAELIARYHVVLGRQVLQVSKDHNISDGVNRMWQFRPDFFISECEYLVTLRNTFFKIFSTERCDYSKIDAKDKYNFKLLLKKPIASTIFTLIGKLASAIYDEKSKKFKLKLLEVNEFKIMFEEGEFEQSRELFNDIEMINESVIREAIKIKLQSMELKLPLAFGNLDMTINDKKTNRDPTIAHKQIFYFRNYKDDDTVEIKDKIVGPGKALEKVIIHANDGIERIKQLGLEFINLVMNEAEKSQVILASKLIARYHVVLGRQVLRVSEDQQLSDSANRIWEFRPDFFTSDCKYLVTLRYTFYKVLSTTRCDQSEINTKDKDDLNLILRNPVALNISLLIGKLLTYDEKAKMIQLLDIKEFKEMFEIDEYDQLRERFNKIQTTESVIREATIIKLKSKKVKLPLAFGNLDKNRTQTIADKLTDLFKYYKDDKNTVEINDKIVGPGKALEKGIVASNGGIGSAVGNLLVFDKQTKTMKFDLENEALPYKAASLLDELKHRTFENNELSSYRIKINIGGFPKDSFQGDEYDKRQARDFLSKLWFYTSQAKEDEVEKITKNGINKQYNHENNQNQFKLRIHTDSIFLRSHDEIQKWWMHVGKTSYLSRKSEIFERAKLAVLENPLLLTALDYMCNLKIQNIGIKFSQNAVCALELDNTSKRIYNVVTDANILSAIKILQHFEKPSLRNKYTFIDFDYVLSLPLNDYNTMRKELGQTKIEILIIFYEKLKYYEGLCNKLKEIIKIFKGKIVIVTERILANEIKKHVGDEYGSVKDDKTYLIDLVESSQTKILEKSTIVFQGDELPVSSVLDQDARSLVRTEILYKLIDGEKIEIGYPLMDQIYKDLNIFIDRRLNDDPVNTLHDIGDEVVVVSGRPGMGKSALLTHLSLNTKQLEPLPWIVRVNLQDYLKEFKRWQNQDSTISAAFIIHFLCTVALKNNEAQIKIELDYHEGKAIVCHVAEALDPVMLFELEWFLYLYNSGQVVFLFDDFNAMNPHYEKEALQILKLLKNEKKRMWITTCPYKHTRIPLENEFGTCYQLDKFNANESKIFLDRFFITNLSLEKLNYDQFENVRSFLKFMSKFTNYRLVSDPDRELLPVFSLIFQLIYTLAVAFFQSEISRASASTIRHRFKANFRIDLDQYTTIDEMLGRAPDDDELELAGTPLHLYIAANYFKVCMEDISFLLGKQEVRDKWNVMLNSVTLYQHYVEAHMKRIFCREDVDDESVRSTYQSTRSEFFDKHKKLGLFAICRENDLAKLLKPNEISEVQDTISRIQRGEDRDSLVNCVVDEVPRFAHLVFAEYFAVEYLTDLMKSLAEDDDDKMNPLRKASLWQSLMNIVLFNAPPGVRQGFDYKLQSDSSLAELANSQTCRDVVFELLLKRSRMAEARGEGDAVRNPNFSDAIEEGFNNIANLLLSSIQHNLNQGNVDEILRLLGRTRDKFAEFGKEYGDTLRTLLDSIRNMDVSRLGDIFRSGRLTEVPLRHANSYASSATASELRERVTETTAQLPRLSDNIQRMSQLMSDVNRQNDTIGQNITSLLGLGVKTLMNDFLATLQGKILIQIRF